MIFRILGIDPGLVDTGLAYMDICYNDLHNKFIIKGLSTETLSLKDIELCYVNSYCGNTRDARIFGLVKWLEKRIVEDNITAIAYETPFYDRRKPNAHETLVEVCSAIRFAAYNVNPMLPVIGYSPAQIKKGLGIKGNAKKEEVTKRVSELYGCYLSSSTQHESDAVAASHKYLMEISNAQTL